MSTGVIGSYWVIRGLSSKSTVGRKPMPEWVRGGLDAAGFLTMLVAGLMLALVLNW